MYIHNNLAHHKTHIHRNSKCHAMKIKSPDQPTVARDSFRTSNYCGDGESIHKYTNHEVRNEVFDATASTQHDPEDQIVCGSLKNGIKDHPDSSEIIFCCFAGNPRAGVEDNEMAEFPNLFKVGQKARPNANFREPCAVNFYGFDISIICHC